MKHNAGMRGEQRDTFVGHTFERNARYPEVTILVVQT
jgi:hypothetical protein